MDLDVQVSDLFEAHRDRVYRYVIRLIGEPSVAEEITQEVFLRLYRSLLEAKQIADMRSWVYAIAHNLAVDFLRGKRPEAGNDWSELADTIPDKSPNPEEQAFRSERSAYFQSALGALPVQQRACVLLRAEGFRYREIAKMLGVAVPTVGESLRRGLDRLGKGLHA
ncbi:MAG: RNA polymerase sigma factor [Puia sp.]|nr:RNA polymerase sigma factor [Puia sp.]